MPQNGPESHHKGLLLTGAIGLLSYCKASFSSTPTSVFLLFDRCGNFE